MGNKDYQNLVGLMAFHLQAAISLATAIVEQEDKELVDLSHGVIDEGIDICENVNAHALWETLRDFFDPDINEAANKLRSTEGGNVIEMPPRKDH